MDTTQEIYLDNSATTRVSKEAAEKALYMMTECYGNPSSLHSKGFAAEKEMTAAREIIAERPVSYTHLDVYKRQDEIGAGSVYGEVGAKLVVTLLFTCRGEEALSNPHGALRRDGDTQLFF